MDAKRNAPQVGRPHGAQENVVKNYKTIIAGKRFVIKADMRKMEIIGEVLAAFAFVGCVFAVMIMMYGFWGLR